MSAFRSSSRLDLLLAAAVAGGLLWACAPPPKSLAWGSDDPNVLLVVLDGARADHLGCYGYGAGTTPNLDVLAKGGLRFTDVVTPSPWSRPAFAALLTGRYPGQIGMDEGAERLAEGAELLTQVLAEKGYKTHAVLSHPFLSMASGLDRGFDRYELVVDRQGWPRGLSAARVTDEALSVIADRRARPFLLVAHYADTLHDWAPVQGFDFGDPDYEGLLSGGLGMGDLLRGRRAWDEADLAELRAHYDSELAYVDAQVGRLLAGLAKRGLDKNTLVVVTSTHGMELFDHDGLGDGQTLHDELIHVPLILAGPGVDGGINEVSASLIDIAPTLLQYLGLRPMPSVQGISLQTDRVGQSRLLFSETDRIRHRRAVMDERWKLIRDLDTGALQLFDILEDPGEQRDLANDAPSRPRRAALEDALNRFLSETNGDSDG